MALLIIVVQAHFIMNNIFEGLIWFFLPAALVITNDIFAYICGITFGRTQLIKLSPKKTVEGFVGAWLFTVIFGYVLTHFMMRSGYFICPVTVSCRGSDLRHSVLYTQQKLTLFRILEQTFSQACIASPTPSSFHTPTRCPNLFSFLPTRISA